MFPRSQSYRQIASRACGFTLLEVMIVVALVAMLCSLAMPSLQRARKRSQAVVVKEDLRLIDGALNQYAAENNKNSGATVEFDSLKIYLDANTALYTTGADLFGNLFGPTFTVSIAPYPPPATYQALLDVTAPGFWSPYSLPP